MIYLLLIPIPFVIYYVYLIMKHQSTNKKEHIKMLNILVEIAEASNWDSIVISEYQFKFVKHALNDKQEYKGYKIDVI